MSAPESATPRAAGAWSARISRLWLSRNPATFLLWPLSMLFGIVSVLRRFAFRSRLLRSFPARRPLVIIGNLMVGGTGKTPVVIALAEALAAHGHRPGILSRGYGARPPAPMLVTAASSPAACGDEPALISRALASRGVPVCVHPDRVAAAEALLGAHPECTVLLCDDGLQHYRLARHPLRDGGRDVEIALFDSRGAGNGWLLPAGPLREPLSRPRDITLVNIGNRRDGAASGFPAASALGGHPDRSWEVALTTGEAWLIGDPAQRRPLASFYGLRLFAAAGIGQPERFFTMLRAFGLHPTTLALPDHHDYVENPFIDARCEAILITEKDAVKCAERSDIVRDPRVWVVPVKARLGQDFITCVLDALAR